VSGAGWYVRVCNVAGIFFVFHVRIKGLRMQTVRPIDQPESHKTPRTADSPQAFFQGSFPPSFQHTLRRFIPQAVNTKDNFGHTG